MFTNSRSIRPLHLIEPPASLDSYFMPLLFSPLSDSSASCGSWVRLVSCAALLGDKQGYFFFFAFRKSPDIRGLAGIRGDYLARHGK
jgi:hypothetical protein